MRTHHGTRPTGSRRHLALATCAGLGLTGVQVTAAWSDPVTVPGLPDGSSSRAVAVNGTGTVAGIVTGEQTETPFVYDGASGQAELLPSFPGHPFISGVLINDAGTVAGTARNDDGFNQAWTWTGGSEVEVVPRATTAESEESSAVDLNGAGQLLVRYEPGSGGPGALAAVVQGGVATEVPGLGGGVVSPSDLNDAGAVVGQARTDDGSAHAFLWTPAAAAATDLHGFGVETHALAVNENGVVAGYATLGSGSRRAFRWTSGEGMQDLGTLGGDYSQAVAVTSAGAVVGTSRLATGGDRAFLWTAQSGEMRSLGSLGGGSSQATGVSDSGVVVGVSRTVTGETHAFSWTPATGMVDLGPAEGVSAVHDVNESGLAVGSAGPAGSEQATTWDTTATDAQPSAPGTARSVTASAGNGEAVVAWAPPLDNGGLDVTSYTVTAVPGGVETTVPATTDGSPNSAVVPGLTNGTAYTFTMTATNVAGTGPSSAASQPVTPRADAVAPTVVVGEATPAAGGSVTTGQATSTSQPVTASVTVPASTSGGAISIAQGSVDKTPPSGFSFFGQQVNIEAPSGTPDNRLVLTFRADDSITGGLSPEDISIFRTEGAGDPTAVPSCYAADEMPDPCVLSRTQETGYLELTVSTSAASAWNFARRAVEPYPFQGFFSPVANPPTYNKVKAGDTVPLKFSLGGQRGLFVLAAGQPVSATVPCAGTGAGTAVPTRGRLTYTSTTGRYTYQWRTERSMAGTCRRFEMTLADGSTHTALFRLTR